MESSFFFQQWSALFRVIVVGILAYVALVLLVRISGKRSLSKMNAFDLVVTVALGSTLATIILSKDVALVEGILAIALLLALQYLVTWSSVRSRKVSQLVKSDPTLLFYDGSFMHGHMTSARVVEDEVLAAVRQQGIASLAEVTAVVLETDGSLTVVKQGTYDPSALSSVAGMPDR